MVFVQITRFFRVLPVQTYPYSELSQKMHHGNDLRMSDYFKSLLTHPKKIYTMKTGFNKIISCASPTT
jgi:hypothetical protein